MNSQLSRGNTLIFVAFSLSLAATTTALTLNLIQGYTPFSYSQLPLSNVTTLYFMIKYEDGGRRIFVVMTSALLISEIFTLIAFFVSLSNLKSQCCIKNQWLVKNELYLLYISASLATIGSMIASGWQTTILIELLLPNQSATTINLASIVIIYLSLMLFILDFILIFKYKKNQDLQQNKREKRRVEAEQKRSKIQFKIEQRPKSRELKPQTGNLVRKDIKSTKKKQEPLKIQIKQNEELQMKEALLGGLKQNYIYQTNPNQLQNLNKISLSQRDMDEHLEKVIDRPESPKRTFVPKLALKEIVAKKKEIQAKQSLSKLDISIILPIRPKKNQPVCQENSPENPSILGRIKQGKIPVEVNKSPRPDIRQIKEALKTQNNGLTPKNSLTPKYNGCNVMDNRLSYRATGSGPLK